MVYADLEWAVQTLEDVCSSARVREHRHVLGEQMTEDLFAQLYSDLASSFCTRRSEQLRRHEQGDYETLASSVFLQSKRALIIAERRQLPLVEELEIVLDQAPNFLSYRDFVSLAQPLSTQWIPYFTAKKFLSLPNDRGGMVRKDHLLTALTQDIRGDDVELQLAAYADTEEGFITEAELERFVFDWVAEVAGLEHMATECMQPMYAFGAVRKLMFMLDKCGSRRLRISTLVESADMAEMLALQHGVPPRGCWYDGAELLNLYDQFEILDVDADGMLSEGELLAYGRQHNNEPVRLTPTAINRIFEVYINYKPRQLDWKGFLDLVLALRYRNHERAIAYFFRVLDLNGTGRVGPHEMRYFFRDVVATLENTCYADIPRVEDEVLNSKLGSQFVLLLLDVDTFYKYDTREIKISEEGDDDNEGLTH